MPNTEALNICLGSVSWSLNVFTRAHVRDGSVDGDGSDLEAPQHLAEPQSLIVAAWTVRGSLREEQSDNEWYTVTDVRAQNTHNCDMNH